MKHFKSPKRSLGDLDAKTAARLISAATDIALVVDKTGKIRDVSCDEAAIEGLDWADWHGKKLVDLVTVERTDGLFPWRIRHYRDVFQPNLGRQF